jgi:hypothetical protein
MLFMERACQEILLKISGTPKSIKKNSFEFFWNIKKP